MERVVPLAKKLLEEKGTILLVCHENPDGDTLGSALALYMFLKKLNKDVYVFCKDNIPRFAQFLPKVNEVLHPKDLEGKTFDLAIIVDAAGFKRANFEISSHLKARIDHHVGGDFYGLYDFIDFTCASTTLLVYELLKYINKDLIDKDIALCLYTGLCTDTGFFRYSNTTKEVFDAASSLCAYGVEPNYIWKNFGEKESLAKLRLISKALENLEIFHNGKTTGIVITQSMIEETGALYEDTEGLVNYPRRLEGVYVAFAMIETKKEDGSTFWRVSLRSKEESVDVSKIAQRLAGGGHKYASGCKLYDDMHTSLYKLLDSIALELSNLEKAKELSLEEVQV